MLRAQDRAGLHPGDALLVVGAGVNGLLQIAAAHAHGVDAVWVREPRPERLERAVALGAELHGNELVDVAIVCTPKPEAIAPPPRRWRLAARSACTRHPRPVPRCLSTAASCF